MNKEVKLAALRLASVHARDRDWILAQLPEAQRHMLSNALTEIAAMGLANPGEVYEQLRREPTTAEALPPALEDHDPERRLMALDPQQAQERLDSLPTPWLLALLRLRDWPWASNYLAACTAERKHQLKSAAQEFTADVPPRLAAVLIAESEAFLHGGAAEPVAGGFLDRLLSA